MSNIRDGPFKCAFDKDRKCDDTCAAWQIGVCRESTTRKDPTRGTFECTCDQEPYLAPYCARGPFWIGLDHTEENIDLTEPEETHDNGLM